jgi:SAM-dependent methyltransferase
MGEEAMSLAAHWDRQYRRAQLPWEPGRPSTELRRVLAAWHVRPCPAIELGCGTGRNAVWLAEQGFEVLGVDVSPLAVQRAREHRTIPGTPVHFLAADLLDWWKLGGPYGFVFDRGCYAAVRTFDRDGYLRTLEQVLQRGALGLLLMGNAGEPEDEDGPPVLVEADVREDFEAQFEVLDLRAFRFDAAEGQKHYLGWSCLLRWRA